MDEQFEDPWQQTSFSIKNSTDTKSITLDKGPSMEQMQKMMLSVPSEDQLSKQLTQAIEQNDPNQLQSIINTIKLHYSHSISKILNSKVNSDSPPLCLAARNGQLATLRILLDNGADINITDQQGWTPFLWAFNNGHENIAEYLRSCGASTDLSAISTQSQRDRDQIHVDTRQKSDFYHGASAFDLEALDRDLSSVLSADQAVQKQSYLDSFNQVQKDEDDASSQSDVQSQLDSASNKSSPQISNFDFGQCLPDQMLVVDSKKCEILIKVIIDDYTIPHITKSSLSQKLAPSIVLFLAARYAHYFQSKDLLFTLLNTFISKFRFKLGSQNNSKDLTFLSYWIANYSQILFYFRRDSGLILSTFEFQATCGEILEQLYMQFTSEARQKILHITVESILYHNIEVYKGPLEKRKIKSSPKKSVKKSNDNLQRASEEDSSFMSRVRSISDTANNYSSGFSFLFNTAKPAPPSSLSPRTLLTHFASNLFLLQQFHVHPIYQTQMISQLVFSVSAEILNSFIDGRLICARSAAMSIRYNLSIIEEWIRSRFDAGTYQNTRKAQNALNSTAVDRLLMLIPVDNVDLLLSPLGQCVSACQLLQVATSVFAEQNMENSSEESIFKQLNDVLQVDTFGNYYIDSLSYEQIKRIIFDNYQYEKDEPSVSYRFLEILSGKIIEQQKQFQKDLKLDKKKSSTDLISFDVPAVDPIRKKKKTLLADTLEWIPFKLQSAYSESHKINSVYSSPLDEWGDKASIAEQKAQKERKEQKEKYDEFWWLQVKIDIPEKIQKLIDS